MPSPNAWLLTHKTWKAALLSGCFAAVAYTIITLGYSLLPSANVSITAPLWQAAGLSLLGSFGTIGVPIVLWVRYRLHSPLVLMGLVLLFWHVLVFVPPIGSGQGDSPSFLFVLVFAPFYLIAYGLVAGGEYWLRGRNISISTSTQ